MDLYTHFIDEYREEFIAARRASGQRYRYGTSSPVVAIIGRLASALRRASAGIEAWATGPADSANTYGQPNVPAR